MGLQGAELLLETAIRHIHCLTMNQFRWNVLSVAVLTHCHQWIVGLIILVCTTACTHCCFIVGITFVRVPKSSDPCVFITAVINGETEAAAVGSSSLDSLHSWGPVVITVTVLIIDDHPHDGSAFVMVITLPIVVASAITAVDHNIVRFMFQSSAKLEKLFSDISK